MFTMSFHLSLMGLFDLAKLSAAGNLSWQSTIRSRERLRSVSPLLNHPLQKFQPQNPLQPRCRWESSSWAPPHRSVFHKLTSNLSEIRSMRPRARRLRRLSAMDAVITMMAQRCMASGNGSSRQGTSRGLPIPNMWFVAWTQMLRLLLLAPGMPA